LGQASKMGQAKRTGLARGMEQAEEWDSPKLWTACTKDGSGERGMGQAGHTRGIGQVRGIGQAEGWDSLNSGRS
jgi:hypothetical protein